MRLFRNFFTLAAFFVTAGIALAQEKPARRLEGITWNPATHKLTWTVSEGGTDREGKFQAKDKISYEIDMDAATMSLNGEDRRFSKAEAVRVHALMDVLAKYAAESTVWWESGEGEPIRGGEGKTKVDSDRERFHQRDKERKIPPAPREPRDRDPVKIITISTEK